MQTCISGQQHDDVRRLSSGSVNGWGGWGTRQRWSRLWSRLTALVRWRCTCYFASPACLRIRSNAILARNSAGRLVLTKHCRVCMYYSLHLFLPRKLNSTLPLFSDLAAWYINEIFHSLYWGTRKAFFGHLRHIPCEAPTGVLQLYPNSMPSHSCRPVENLADISCCF